MKFNFFKKKWGQKKEEESLEQKERRHDDKKDRTVNLKKIETAGIIPLVTEKNLSLAKENVYVFKSDFDFNKNKLKKIISEMFNVTVTKIRTINYPKRTRGKSKLKNVRPKFKKVLVKLAPGQKISIFE